MDGSRVLYRLLPYAGRSFLDRIEPYGMWIIIIFAFFGVFDIILRTYKHSINSTDFMKYIIDAYNVDWAVGQYSIK